MKFALYSDLHNEFGTPWNAPESAVALADAIILAGDIGSHTHGLEWAATEFPEKPIVYVAGNHEYYQAQLGLLDELRKTADRLGIHFLERDSVVIAGVRFLGCTLWSGFDLNGSDQIEANMDIVKRGINDYWMIQAAGGKRLKPRDTLKLYRKSWRWLDEELNKPSDGKTVVVTHFAPHPGCVAPEHEGSDVSPYFVSDLSDLMAKYRPAVWAYGHTHSNISLVAEGGCRVVANQLGYPSNLSRGFQPDLLIEV